MSYAVARRRPTPRRLLAATAAVSLTAPVLAVLPGLASPAAAAEVGTLADLVEVVGECTTSAEVTLTDDIADTVELTIPCDLTIDLAGHDLTLRNLVIGAGETFEATDSTAVSAEAGTLTANTTGVNGVAAIQNTGATLVTSGTVHVVARGGNVGAGIGGSNVGGNGGTVVTHDDSTITASSTDYAAGIGGAYNGSGGSLTVNDSSAVTAAGHRSSAGIGGSVAGAGATIVINGGTVTAHSVSSGTAIGGGTSSTSFGSLTMNSGILRLPSGSLQIPDSNPTGPEITISGSSAVTGTATAPFTHATITGTVASTGQIANDGLITLPTANVQVPVTGHHYEVSFDAAGGTDPAPVVVFASSLAAGARQLPADPARAGWTFQGWYTAPDETGVRFTTDSTLPGSSPADGDGSPAEVTVHARWSPQPITALANRIAECEGGVLTLDADILAPDAELAVPCDAVLDLAGHDLAVRNVIVDPDAELEVTDTSASSTDAGTLTANATGFAGLAGIWTSAAALTTSGTATVSARGGLTAVGGTGSFGAVSVEDSSTLHLPGGSLVVPDSDLSGPEIAVGAQARITGSATIVGGASAGQIANGGAITIAAANVHVPVIGHHYQVFFDLNGGAGGATGYVTVLAGSFADGARSLPADPTRTGWTFEGWNTEPDGTGTPLTATATLPGASTDGNPVAIVASAQWAPRPTTLLAERLAECDDDVVALDADLADASAALPVPCDTVLDLSGHDLTVRNVVIEPGATFEVTDTTASGVYAGTLTADAGGVASTAGVQNTAATFIASGTAHVVAQGGGRAAGIGGANGSAGGTTVVSDDSVVSATSGGGAAGLGGGWSGDGGTVTIDGGTVIASGATTAVGAGLFRDATGAFGSLTVNGGTLRLPEGVLVVPDSDPTGAEITVSADGVIDGSGGASPTYATITGADPSAVGQIANGGTILLPGSQIEVPVTGHHYEISFDLVGGTAAGSTDPVLVYAATLADAGRALPAEPTLTGSLFAGWNTKPDGTGTPLTAAATLPGTSTDGTAVPLTAHAQWAPASIAVPTPTLTSDGARGFERPAVGDRLTAAVGATDPADAVVAWRWMRARGGTTEQIPGATSASYVLTPADLDSRITVTAVATLAPRTPAEATSTPTGVVEPGTLAAPRVRIAGKARENAVLRAVVVSGGSRPAGYELAYSWRRGGKEVWGGDRLRYRVRVPSVNRKLRLVVSASAPGYTSAQTTSAPTRRIAPAERRYLAADVLSSGSGPRLVVNGHPSARVQSFRIAVGDQSVAGRVSSSGSFQRAFQVAADACGSQRVRVIYRDGHGRKVGTRNRVVTLGGC